MPPKIRSLLATRAVALGFIYLILVGNLWFGLHLTSKNAPEWIGSAFVSGVSWVALAGAILIGQWILMWSRGELHSEPEDEPNSED